MSESKKYYKLTNDISNNRNYHLKDGLNIDNNNINDINKEYGLNFCDLDTLLKWSFSLHYEYVYDVEVPDDAIVIEHYNRKRSNKLILKNYRHISELDIWNDNKLCIDAIRQHPMSLKYIKNPTKEQCIEAINIDGYVIKYINEPSYELCLLAVKKHGTAIQFITNKTKELCIESVTQNPYALKYVFKYYDDEIIDYVKKEYEYMNVNIYDTFINY